MEKNYKAFIHKEENSCLGITFPDFPGCVATGDNTDELLRNAKEALQFHIDTIYEFGQHMPEPGTISDEWISGECDDILAVAIMSANIPGKNLRINISMADYVVERVDKFAKSHGQTRSGVLSNAVLEYIS